MVKFRAKLCAASRRVGTAAGALALTACAMPDTPLDAASAALEPAEIVADCCAAAETYPEWVVDLAEANIETVRHLGLIQFRPGYLTRDPRPRAVVEEALRPMDLVFFHSDNRMSGLLIPGQFTHSAVYLGDEAQLRAAGLWHLPALDPWRDEIAAGDIYLEGVDGGVRLASGDIVYDTDAVAVLRPRGMNNAAALRRGMARMGVPYDMFLDATDGSELFCIELISEMYPEANLPLTSVPGRETILIDSVVAGALSGELPFGLVGYVEARADGSAEALSAQELAWDIRQGWPEKPQMP